MVLGITSDVGERSSVWSDGICARKGKLVIQDCWLRNNKKITNLSKTFQLTSSSCTVSSVNGANANGMKFSGISTASVNIFQLRTVQQALKAAWRSTTLVTKAIFTINVSKWNEVFKFPVSPSWMKKWCFYFEHIIEFGMHISGLIEPGQAQATWLFSLCENDTYFKKRKTIFTWCQKQNADFIFLQETHSKIDSEKCWLNKWWGEIIVAHGSSNSCRVAILVK